VTWGGTGPPPAGPSARVPSQAGAGVAAVTGGAGGGAIGDADGAGRDELGTDVEGVRLADVALLDAGLISVSLVIVTDSGSPPDSVGSREPAHPASSAPSEIANTIATPRSLTHDSLTG